MKVSETTAPSYEELRPLKPLVTGTFPVHKNLVESLVNAGTHPDPVTAHVLATCAGYAYSDAETVAMVMARLGLAGNRCRTLTQRVDAMLIDSTAFVVQSDDGRVVILCYRGTIPTSGINWLSDFDVNPQSVPIAFPGEEASFDVHGGFYRNVRATRHEVIRALERAQLGQSVLDTDDGAPVGHPMQVLYIAGHSLGGAMASLMAIMLRTEPAYAELAHRLRAVYTFGAPMVGSPELAHACDRDEFLHDRLLRYVFQDDIVPQCPPTAVGRFAHFGREFRYTRNGGELSWQASKARAQLRSLLDIVATPLTFIARQLQLTRSVRFHASLYDHLPALYIAALTPAGVRTEFGD